MCSEVVPGEAKALESQGLPGNDGREGVKGTGGGKRSGGKAGLTPAVPRQTEPLPDAIW